MSDCYNTTGKQTRQRYFSRLQGHYNLRIRFQGMGWAEGHLFVMTGFLINKNAFQ